MFANVRELFANAVHERVRLLNPPAARLFANRAVREHVRERVRFMFVYDMHQITAGSGVREHSLSECLCCPRSESTSGATTAGGPAGISAAPAATADQRRLGDRLWLGLNAVSAVLTRTDRSHEE